MQSSFNARSRLLWSAALLFVLLLPAIAACQPREYSVAKAVPGGDPAAGARAIELYGCGSCHQIPGIRSANSFVGPPLERFDRRHYIAGAIPNTAENLIVWLMNPQLIEPGTAMPDVGLSELEARNIAAYLYSQ